MDSRLPRDKGDSLVLSRSLRIFGSTALLLALAGVPASAAGAASRPSFGSPDSGAAQPSAAAVRKIALGVSMLPSAPGSDLADYLQFKTDVGRAPATWSMWVNWGGGGPFPSGPIMNQLKADKTVPLIIWQPVGNATDQQTGKYSRYNLIAGYRAPSGKVYKPKYDKYIRQFAKDAKSYNAPILLRLAHEMDGGWFPWGVTRYDNTPANFIKAWRHIWTIFQQEGATKVRFYWSPLSPDVREHIYPGDRYVSYIGMSAFNWDETARGGWLTMRDAYKARYKRIAKISSRPVIVGESGSAPGNGTTHNKNTWITDGYAAVYAQMTKIKGIIYFNVDMRGAAQPDWRITGAGSSGLSGYRAVVSQTRFKGTIK
jgi:mannan endo-1,4-beta-mannosidase